MSVIEILPTENSNPTIANACLPSQKILVVDDEPLICQLYKELLTEKGFEVDTAPDGGSAWYALQAKEYDLVITDNKMPVLSGTGLIVKIHQSCMTVPIILASGTVPSEDFVYHSLLQPAVVLIKPYGPEELMAAVREVLNAPVKSM